MTFQLLNKQNNAVYYLKDNVTREVGYGGAAGGGKSALGCLWIMECCQRYPGTRWLIGRSKLKTLKETTFNTFQQLASEFNLTGQYRFNSQSNIVYWNNGSEILLKDLFLYPSDPEFESLGSLEITGAFIDECTQITYKAWQIVKSRIRYKLNEFNLLPKMLGTCNPQKNWVYLEFYKKDKDGTLPEYRKFIQSLPTDNPYLPKTYLESLLELDKNSRERLYYGNWEYDDNPNALVGFEEINNIFTNEHVLPTGKRYITADIARLGSDKAVIMVWDGFVIIDIIEFALSRITDIQNAINSLKIKYSVPNSNIIADEDGVGGGVVDNCRIKGFLNNSRALNNENYQNLKSQCYYKLAEQININNIYIQCEISSTQREDIVKDLENLQSWQSDSDGKLKVKPKVEIKSDIGRSPDYMDNLAMRMYFTLHKQIGVINTKVN